MTARVASAKWPKQANKAIHDPEMFHRDYSAERVEEVLTNTRKVLEELYRLPS
jgi:hypothetical protein